MTLLISLLVFLFALVCSIKAIAAQRKNQQAFLVSADARRAAFASDYSELLAIIEQDKKDGLI
jgi:hypothetical protein